MFMRAALLSRLERLESHAAAAAHKIKLRFGNLRRLPPDYKGEKHVVVAKELPIRNGQEWVEFEELPGPDPHRRERRAGVPDGIDVMFVTPYPIEGEYSR